MMKQKIKSASPFIAGVIYLYFLFLYQSVFKKETFSLIIFFCGCALLFTVIYSWATPKSNWKKSLFLGILTISFFHRIGLFIPEVSNSPWSLNWSEGSRYYYASLFFDNSIYGKNVPSSILHPARYLLQSIGFLFPNSPIWFHRLWQVVLWLTTTLGVGWLFFRRLQGHFGHLDNTLKIPFIVWSYVFLMQGPIYYHLLVIPMLIIWGTHPKSFLKSTIIILLTSIWAGITRLNWFPMPGLLTAVLYLLEETTSRPGYMLEQKKEHFNYRYIVIAGIFGGTLVAFLSSYLYTIVSRNSLGESYTALTTDLLWYRLIPNPTNPAGILPQIILVTAPILVITFYRLRILKNNTKSVYDLGLLAISAILLTGGLIVSIKIGGGADLHNLDAYLITLWMIGSYYYFEFLAVSPKNSDIVRTFNTLTWFALIIPVVFTLYTKIPEKPINESTEYAELQILKNKLSKINGEVLFINQRQLITFGEINNIALVPDYEAVYLMEMSMANNQKYLDKFHSKIKKQYYAYIVSYTLSIVHKGRFFPFGEENDIWVEQVSEPILCYYEPILTLDTMNMQVLASRQNNCNTP